MNWIRIATGITRDPRIIYLSEALGVSVPTTTGHVVGVLTSMSEGATDGDLSQVSDVTLESWAMWRGKRGRFANALREQLCTAQGVMRAWEKYNGAAIRKVEADRERKRLWRLAQKDDRSSGGRHADEKRTSGGLIGLRDVTGRDELLNNNKQQLLAPVAVAPALFEDSVTVTKRPRKPPPDRPAAKFPRFAKDTCDRMYHLWVSKFGAVDYSRFRAQFGPLFSPDESERCTDAELCDALKSYVDLAPMGGSANFATVGRAAGCLAAIATVRRDHAENPEARADAVMRIIHGQRTRAA